MNRTTHVISEIGKKDWTEADWEDLHNTMRALQDRIAKRHGKLPSGPYYMIRGFNSEGVQIVGMPIHAASASAVDIQRDALLMLEDAGHNCASATVHPMKAKAS